MLDESLLTLLRLGLRSRAATVQALAELAIRPVDEVRADLGTLAGLGYVELFGDDIGYVDPDRVFATGMRERTSAMVGGLDEHLKALEGLIRVLPTLVAEWRLGRSSDSPLVDVEVFHGWSAVTDLWHYLLGKYALRRTDVVLPDAQPLAVPNPEMQAVWHAHISAPGSGARLVGSATDAASEALAARIASEAAGGLEIRMHPRPPGFFWVADGEVVALPLEWGASWPTTLLAVRSPALAGMAQHVFDRIWESAVAVGAVVRDWDPVLRLMAGGATLETASRALGISARTGRRRIAEAMEHYGVSSVLGLGAAWGSDPGAAR